MPSSVEIVAPTELAMKSKHVTDFFNDLLAKLHDVDMRFKKMNAANLVLESNLKSLMANTIALVIQNKPASIAALSAKTGVTEKKLQRFLTLFEEEKLIMKKDGLYTKYKNG